MRNNTTTTMPTTHHPDPQPTPKRHSINARRFSIPLANSMNASEEELPPFPTPEISTLRLDHKPSAKLHYTYYPSSTPNGHSNPFSQTLIVFLNGLMSTRSSWDLSISSFLEKRIAGRLPYPSILSYDRYGQGESERDPSDRGEEGHDATVAVHDLKQVILQIWRDHLDQNKPTHFPSLIFVCNSIGCALARLFAQANPGTVSGLLFLDSIMANSDGQDMWPDPDGPEFSEHTLPDGVSVQELRETRRKYKEVFGPEVMSKEGLSRRNLRQLLPESDRPRVEGYLGKGPVLTVVGHDWETFAEQSRECLLLFFPVLWLFNAICSHRLTPHPQTPDDDIRESGVAPIQRRPHSYHRSRAGDWTYHSRELRALYSD